MTNISDNAITADSSKKSMDLARKELSAILEKIDDLRLPVKAWRLLHARSRFRPTKLIKVRARHLWLFLLIATWITVQVTWTHVLTYRYSKVRQILRYCSIIYISFRYVCTCLLRLDSILIPWLNVTRHRYITYYRLFLLIQIIIK